MTDQRGLPNRLWVFDHGPDALWRDEYGQTHSTVALPGEWSLFWAEPNTGQGVFVLPECKRVNLGLPQNLGWVWKAFSTYSTHRYALGVRVAVPIGARLIMGAGVWTWSSTQDSPMESIDGSYRTRIGIDPFGGINPNSEDVEWSHPAPGLKAMDSLVDHTVEDEAQAGKVTLWLWGDSEWRVKHNDAYWTDVSLWIEGGQEPPPAGDLEARLARLEAIEAERETVSAFGLQFVTKRN